MLLKELIIKLQELVKENPEAEDYIVVHSLDEEGESFEPIYFNEHYGFWNDEESIFIDKFDCRKEGKEFNAIWI